MKSISTSTYTFENLIKGNYLYVDKTRFFYKLVKEERGQYFCSRPRRFGKSLAISTFEAIFQGKRELFKGLYIDRQEYDWQEYPVVHIDFARTVLQDKATISRSLDHLLNDCAENYGVELAKEDPANMFAELIRKLYKKTDQPVVLLIDEYDKPLLDHMNTPEEAEEWRNFMDNFYQVIKGAEPMLRFVFITGVTKFAKVSIFSKLNNLRDITMSRAYAQMFGYTQEELENNFNEYLEDAVKQGVRDTNERVLNREELLAEIRRWYDGFKFSEYGEKVYNPVSVGQFMIEEYEFRNYWFSTGTPSFLMKLMKRNGIIMENLDDALMSADSFDTFDVTELAGDLVDTDKIIQMLYQTGYQTIDYGIPGRAGRTYALCYPNFEVKNSFEQHLYTAYTGKDSTTFGVRLERCAAKGDTVNMMELLTGYFAGMPYDIQIPAEKYYQSIVRVIFDMAGMDIVTEERTNIGRIDAVLNTGKHLYIIEFKFNKTAEEGLDQIEGKKYAQKYILPAREQGQIIHKLAVNFCYAEEKRNVEDWKEEVLR